MLNATAYKYELSATQTLYIGGSGLTTTVTLQSGHSGQQQQSSNQFSTGKWTAVPLLYSLGEGVVVVISTITETYYLQVQGTQMQMSTGPISAELAAYISQAHPLPLQTVEAMPAATLSNMSPMPPMSSMSPMPPMQMKMGNMEMNMDSRAVSSSASSTNFMRGAADSAAEAESFSSLGQNSSETNAESPSPKSSTKVKRFCSQCGSAILPSDNFCSYCGARLGNG